MNYKIKKMINSYLNDVKEEADFIKIDELVKIVILCKLMKTCAAMDFLTVWEKPNNIFVPSVISVNKSLEGK